ncbi:hypothetical protein [Hymenobacter armeniacus]|uniref:YcxB-like protein domain-containing protein n=1 Tax=Hymenobacter armeniacus TaxID=2771358 RepID=A0ABR8JR65_9BACT|nr:hypothetical protein [Hymenobacter armeniacus]MBD2722460.1 hypothetical protein [Hymenobacter armeniacus]
MQPIVFEKSPMTLAEFSSINWLMLRKKIGYLIIFPIIVLLSFVVTTCNMVVGMKSDDTTYPMDSESIMTMLGGALFVGFIYYSYRKAIKKNYLNTPALSEGLNYTLTEELIQTQSSTINGSQPWAASFKTANKVGKWILLPSSGNAFFFLDTEKILPPSTMSDVEELFNRKGVKLKK